MYIHNCFRVKYVIILCRTVVLKLISPAELPSHERSGVKEVFEPQCQDLSILDGASLTCYDMLHPTSVITCQGQGAKLSRSTAQSCSRAESLFFGLEEGPLSGHVRPRQGTEICNFGVPSPLDFLSFLQWNFCLFSRRSV